MKTNERPTEEPVAGEQPSVCEWEGCETPATRTIQSTLARSSRGSYHVRRCCDQHADAVIKGPFWSEV